MDAPDRGGDSAAWVMDGARTSVLTLWPFPFFPGTITKSWLCASVAIGTRKHLITWRLWDRWTEQVWIKRTLFCPFTPNPGRLIHLEQMR